MEARMHHPRPTTVRLLTASGVMAITTLGIAWIAKSSPDASGCRAAAALGAIGTMICAAIGAPVHPYPRWSYWTASGIIALAVLTSPYTARSAQEWLDSTRDMIWMAPWMLMMLWSVPSRSRGACDPARSASGHVLAGGALLVGVMILFIGRL